MGACVLAALIGAVASACGAPADALPEGALARVGARVFEADDVVGLKPQLGPYAQVRFRGAGGLRAMVQALVDAELLAQEAVRAGLGHDPRVAWALIEDEAAAYLRAELERRVPREQVARDEAALRAYYEAHQMHFMAPERRQAEGVVFKRLARAQQALEQARAGTPLSELGEVWKTEAMVRDDEGFPGLHPILFDPALRPGDLLPVPVYVGRGFMVARLLRVEPARPRPLSDPDVREAVVDAVLAPRRARARAALLAELRAGSVAPAQGG